MTYEEAKNDTPCKKVMNSFNKKLQFLEYCERQNFKNICLWNACRTFDAGRNVTFITHLYTVLKYSTLKEYTKYKKHNLLKINIDIGSTDNLLKCGVVDHIDALTPIYKDILEKRFVIGMSLKEIAKEYDIKISQCENLIVKAKESLKKSLQEISA